MILLPVYLYVVLLLKVLPHHVRRKQHVYVQGVLSVVCGSLHIPERLPGTQGRCHAVLNLRGAMHCTIDSFIAYGQVAICGFCSGWNGKTLFGRCDAMR
jgi:hypothetical protein